MLSEARDDFKYYCDRSYEDASGMQAWYNMEKDFGQSWKTQISICDYVINSKTFTPTVKHEFIYRKAVTQYFQARDSSHSDAFNLYEASLANHLRAYKFFWDAGHDANLQHKRQEHRVCDDQLRHGTRV